MIKSCCKIRFLVELAPVAARGYPCHFFLVRRRVFSTNHTRASDPVERSSPKGHVAVGLREQRERGTAATVVSLSRCSTGCRCSLRRQWPMPVLYGPEFPLVPRPRPRPRPRTRRSLRSSGHSVAQPQGSQGLAQPASPTCSADPHILERKL